MRVDLFGLNKDKSYKTWSIEVKDGLNGDAYLLISSGKEGGKQVEKSEYFGYGSGKQGRSAFEQAVNEAYSRIKKNKDKNYRETKEELTEIPLLAMLAKDHTKVGGDWTDRGPHSNTFLDYAHIPSVRGNHEQMFIEGFESGWSEDGRSVLTLKAHGGDWIWRLNEVEKLMIYQAF